MAHNDLVSEARDIVAAPVGRRGAIKAVAAVCAVSATSAIATPALAAIGANTQLRSYSGRIAIDSTRVDDCYLAAPQRKANLDVIVVIPEAGTSSAAAEESVRRYALAGYFAITPRLAPTKHNNFASRDAIIADFVANAGRLKRFGVSSGKVTLVSAA